MQNIFVIQFPTFSVFEPFLSGLVTADLGIPRHFWNAFKILRIVDVHVSFLDISVLTPPYRRLWDIG
jgi:hypothetical protein